MATSRTPVNLIPIFEMIFFMACITYIMFINLQMRPSPRGISTFEMIFFVACDNYIMFINFWTSPSLKRISIFEMIFFVACFNYIMFINLRTGPSPKGISIFEMIFFVACVNYIMFINLQMSPSPKHCCRYGTYFFKSRNLNASLFNFILLCHCYLLILFHQTTNSLPILKQKDEEGTTDEEIEKCSEDEDGGKSYCYEWEVCGEKLQDQKCICHVFVTYLLCILQFKNEMTN